MTERDLPSRGQPAPPEEVTGISGEEEPVEEMDIEGPEADVMEQRADLYPEEEEVEEPLGEAALDADEADVSEQRRSVGEPAEEEYR